jgi:hypothetical protein
MVSKKHALITACDAKCADFLRDHWLPSLRDNVRLDDIDVIVLDYGLTPEQQRGIDAQGVIRCCRPRDGFVNNLRFRDVAALLEEASYDQVLLIDSGDIIFQADISDVFEKNKDTFRIVCEQKYTAQYEYFISTSDFEHDDYTRMVKSLRGTHIINSGVVFGPASRFRQLWPSMRELVKGFQNWGTLQLALNYLFYRDGFVEIPYQYNFIIMTARSKYRIVDSRFYDSEGKLIPVVHNAGGKDLLRYVTNFGYGPGRNRRKWLMPLALNSLFLGVRWWKALVRRVTT